MKIVLIPPTCCCRYHRICTSGKEKWGSSFF